MILGELIEQHMRGDEATYLHVNNLKWFQCTISVKKPTMLRFTVPWDKKLPNWRKRNTGVYTRQDQAALKPKWWSSAIIKSMFVLGGLTGPTLIGLLMILPFWFNLLENILHTKENLVRTNLIFFLMFWLPWVNCTFNSLIWKGGQKWQGIFEKGR